MRALLDTHTFLWSVTKPAKLSRAARLVVDDLNNEIIVSAVTAWEIATKVRIGKMPEAVLIEHDFESILSRAGYGQIEITLSNALRAGRLIGAHRDPWDRMLAAQALELDIMLVSRDREMDDFGVRRIW